MRRYQIEQWVDTLHHREKGPDGGDGGDRGEALRRALRPEAEKAARSDGECVCSAVPLRVVRHFV